MEVSPFLPLGEGLQIERVMESADRLVVSVSSTSSRACCLLCGVFAQRIHSRYTRRVADLPCAGRQVTLRLTVRKFFCPNPTCLRKIFAEQFPDLVQAYARITNRLHDALVALGLATSGEVTSQLAPKLGMRVKPTTILRRLRPWGRCASLEWMILPGRRARPTGRSSSTSNYTVRLTS
jgi:transposase